MPKSIQFLLIFTDSCSGHMTTVKYKFNCTNIECVCFNLTSHDHTSCVGNRNNTGVLYYDLQAVQPVFVGAGQSYTYIASAVSLPQGTEEF